MKPTQPDGGIQTMSAGNNDTLPADVLAILNSKGQAKTRKVFDKNNDNNGGGMKVLSVQDDNPLDRWHEVEYQSMINVGELIKALKDNPNIDFVQPSFIYKPAAIPNDSLYGNQWHLPAINAPAGWDIYTGNSNVKIAIIDTGVQLNHPDLATKIIPGWDFIDDDADASPDPLYEKPFHGTVVAGLATAIGNNGVGVTGVDWNAKIMPLKVFGSRPNNDPPYYDLWETDTRIISRAIYWAVQNGANVINMSLGSDITPTILQNLRQMYALDGIYSDDAEFLWFLENLPWLDREACYYAYEHNVVVVATAGNEQNKGNGYYHMGFPAAFNSVIAVGSLDNSNKLSAFSNTFYGGKYVDLVAPGEGMISTSLNNSYGGGDGTSYAAPLVSGLAALLKGKYPSLTSSQIRRIMSNTATSYGSSPVGGNKDRYYGYGKINVYEALYSAGIAPQTIGKSIPPSKSDTNQVIYLDKKNRFDDFVFTWSPPVSYAPIAGYHFNWTDNPNDTTENYGAIKANSIPIEYDDWTFPDGDIEYLRVRAVDDEGVEGEWTTVLTIHYSDTLLFTPANETVVWTNASNVGKREWGPATSTALGVKGYNVYWGTDINGTNSTLQTGTSYTPVTLTTAGIYYLRVQAVSNAGNVSGYKTILTYQFDNAAPAQTATSPTTVNWTSKNSVEETTWLVGTDTGGSGVKGYNVYWGTSVNGTAGTFQTSTNYLSQTLGTAGIYYLRVQTVDNAGNTSTWKDILEYRFDNAPPEQTATDFGTVDWTNSNVVGAKSWTAAADAHSGVKGYNVYWGTSANAETGIFQTGISYTPAALTTAGIYYLRVQTVDNVGNTSNYKTILTYQYDTLLSGLLEIYTDKTLRLTNTDFTSSNILELRLTVNYEDYTKVSMNIRLNNQQIQDWTQLADVYTTKVIDLTALPGSLANNGTKTVEITIRNALGKQITCSRNIIVDTTPPAITGPALTNNGGSSTNRTYTLAAADTAAGVDITSGVKGYYVYWGKDAGGISDQLRISSQFSAVCDQGTGNYYLRVKAIDQLENSSAWETRVTYNFDNTPPVGSISIVSGYIKYGEEYYTSSTNIGLALSYTGNNEIVTMQIYGCLIDGADALNRLRVTNNVSIRLVSGDGPKAIRVQYSDIFSNQSIWYYTYITLDTTKPYFPATTNVTMTTQNNLLKNFTWNAAADNYGVASYNVYWGKQSDGTEIKYTTNTPGYDKDTQPTSEQLICPDAGVYYLRVQAVDIVGNTSSWVTVLKYLYDSDFVDDKDDDTELKPPIYSGYVIGNSGTGEKIWSFPNPFSPASGHTMKIAYEVQEAGWNKVAIYNRRGQKIWQTNNYADPDGNNIVIWDGRDARGRLAGNGTYILILIDEKEKIIARGRLMLLD